MTTYSKLQKGNLSEPGQWRLFRGVTVYFSCPNCGQRVEVRRADHWVTDDGVVRPSVECSGEGCGFHNYLILELNLSRRCSRHLVS